MPGPTPRPGRWRWTPGRWPRSTGRSACASFRAAVRRRERVLEVAEPGGGELDPAQVGLEVEERVVGQQLVDELARPLQLGQLAHALHVPRFLGVQKALR